MGNMRTGQTPYKERVQVADTAAVAWPMEYGSIQGCRWRKDPRSLSNCYLPVKSGKTALAVTRQSALVPRERVLP
jgi:hypothetical protein